MVRLSPEQVHIVWGRRLLNDCISKIPYQLTSTYINLPCRTTVGLFLFLLSTLASCGGSIQQQLRWGTWEPTELNHWSVNDVNAEESLQCIVVNGSCLWRVWH